MEHDEGLTQGAGVIQHREVTVHADTVSLKGNLAMPKDVRAIVLFAHGSGSSRHSPRNRFVADTLNAAGLATRRPRAPDSAARREGVRVRTPPRPR